MMRRAYVGMAVGVLVLLAACSSDDTTGAQGTSSTQETSSAQVDPVCDALAQLGDSFEALGDISIEEGTLENLEEIVGQIQTDLQAVKGAADGDLATALGTFESTLEELADSVGTVVEAPSATSIAGLVAEVADVQVAWGSVQEAAPDCQS